jgi:hypothetical protein
MSISQLKVELNGRIGKNLMPSGFPIEFLISWCREVAKHDDGVLDPQQDDELFDMLNSFLEGLLLAQGVERLNFFRKNRDSLFDALARELDKIVHNELVSRIIGYDINHVELEDLFREHFPGDLGVSQF